MKTLSILRVIRKNVNPRWLKVMIFSLVLGVLAGALDVFMGFLLGTERYLVFMVVFGISLAISVTDEIIWWLIMSDIKKFKRR